MKILITGGSGLLGSYLNNELSKTNEILSVYYRNSENSNRYNSQKIDIRDEEKLNSLFNSFRPAIVIHTAAMTNPILSPDLVYAGYRGSMLNEESKLIPVSLYAETKLMGEIKIQETFDNYLNLRIALLYGFGLGKKKNHFEEMYNNLKAGNTVKLFHDQYRTPLSLTEAARIINELCNKNIKSEVINVGGKERVNRIEMGEFLCNITGFNKDFIQKISVKDIPYYPAVEDVSMNTEKLQSLGIKQKSIKESIKEILH